MDFQEILERWEKSRAPVDMEAALKRYPPDAAPGAGREGRIEPGPPRPFPDKPQAELDLHGLNSVQAEEVLDRFIRDAKARGLSLVLLIHGKGNHSTGEPVLARVVRSYLEKCPLTGAFGPAARDEGGRGATRVRIR